MRRPDDIDDSELVKASINELPYNTASFEILVKRYEKYLFKVSFNYLKNEEWAREAVQETYIRAFHGIKKFLFKSSFKSWLTRISLNVCNTKSTKIVSEASKINAYVHDRSYSKYSEDMTHRVSTNQAVHIVLGSMGQKEKEILQLRHFADSSIEEIAKTLNISESACKMRLYRAQESFKNKYEKFE